MLKVLYLPLNADPNDQACMYEAWRNLNIELNIFDYYQCYVKNKNVKSVGKEFVEAVQAFQPDLVHMQLQMTNIIDAHALQKARSVCNKPTIFVNWSGDVRNHAAKEIVSVSPYVDYTLMSSTGQIPLYEKAGAKNVRYWQIGYDQKLFYPKNYNKFEYDISFAGNAYPPGTFADTGLRANLLRSLKKKYGDRFGLFGSGYPAAEFGKTQSMHKERLNEAYNKSACVLSISNYNDISHYFSDRLLTCLASGRPTISYRFPKYDSYFCNNSDILIANSLSDIYNMVDFCVANPEDATRIGLNGAARVQHEHTYQSRVVELLQMLGLDKKL